MPGSGSVTSWIITICCARTGDWRDWSPPTGFFGTAPDVLNTLKERVAANALELARHGQPKAPFYVTGQVDGRLFSVHAEGERLILKKDGQDRQEIELAGTSPSPEAPDAALESAGADAAPEKGSGSGTDDAGPLPVCPSSAPSDRPGEPASSAPPAPGQGVLDEQRLQQELDAAGEAPTDRSGRTGR